MEGGVCQNADSGLGRREVGDGRVGVWSLNQNDIRLYQTNRIFFKSSYIQVYNQHDKVLYRVDNNDGLGGKYLGKHAYIIL